MCVRVAWQVTQFIDLNETPIRQLTDGGHFGEIALLNVDGTIVHIVAATAHPGTPTDDSDDESDHELWPHNLGHTDEVRAVAVTPDGEHIISGSKDHRVKVWSVARKKLVSTFDANSGVNAVAAMPDGQRILSGDNDGIVRLWPLKGVRGRNKCFNHHTSDARPVNQHAPLDRDDEHPAAVWAVVAMPDNQHALAGSQDKTVKLINVNSRPSASSVLRTFRHHTDPVRCLCLLPDGIRFVSGSEDYGRLVLPWGPTHAKLTKRSDPSRQVVCIVETGLAPL